MVKQTLLKAGRHISGAMKEMIATSANPEVLTKLVEQVKKAQESTKGNHAGDLRIAKAKFKEVCSALSDLSYGVRNDILEARDARREMKEIRAFVKEEFLPVVSDLTDDAGIAPNVTVGHEQFLARKNGTGLQGMTTLGEGGTDIDKKEVVRYANLIAEKLPKSIKTNGGVKVFNGVPIVAIGVFGAPLEKLRTIVKLNTVLDGYCIIEKQYVLGLDTGKWGTDEDKLLKEAKDILESANSTEKLVIADDICKRYGSVAYFWVMPDRVLTRIMNRLGHLADEWGFPSKMQKVGKVNDAGKKIKSGHLTPQKIKTIFDMMIRGADFDKIAAAVGLRPNLIGPIIRGEIEPDKTREGREKFQKLRNSKLSQHIDLMRSVDLEINKHLKKSPHFVRND